jgi:hypothetical protein
MAVCDKCEKDVVLLKFDKEKREWLCECCYYGTSCENNAPMAKTFKPYVLRCGPINEKISDSDPNKIKDDLCGGFSTGVYIDSEKSQKKYYDQLGIRDIEKGEKIYSGTNTNNNMISDIISSELNNAIREQGLGNKIKIDVHETGKKKKPTPPVTAEFKEKKRRVYSFLKG